MHEPIPVARYKTGSVHLVYASGRPADGSLYGLSTYCAREILDGSWVEVTPAAADCARCLKVQVKYGDR